MAQGSSDQADKLLTFGMLPPRGSEGLAPAYQSDFKRADPPNLGEKFGVSWGDDFAQWRMLPGGGIIQFNLDRLTLSDFRTMRDHYQINASLAVLTFMLHQLDWHIECDNERIRKHCQENMSLVWTRLIRAISQSFWAGYSPNVLQWENDLGDKTIKLTKIKDLMPEDCEVNWKLVDGYAPPGHVPPRLRVYDGIKQKGGQWPIPVENSFWYPLLMENGNYYGRKLLRPAFTSWYFSILMHLFSNRYFERYGEPTPMGRAPYDDEVDINGKKVNGRLAMLDIIQSVRNRAGVVLPNNRYEDPSGKSEWEYTLEYLESQMRGADFERYLMRLDEEISLALFTPLLMLRTADVGSYNLGTQHSHVYMQMLNAIAGDAKQYIDGYILERMVQYNFGPNAKRARIKFRKLSDDRVEMVKALLQQLFAGGRVMPDLDEMGEIAGLKLHEVEVLTEPPATDPKNDPNADPNTDPSADPAKRDKNDKQASDNSLRTVIHGMSNRIDAQMRRGPGKPISLGYEKQYVAALVGSGMSHEQAQNDYAMLAAWVAEADEIGSQYLQAGLQAKLREVVGDSAA